MNRTVFIKVRFKKTRIEPVAPPPAIIRKKVPIQAQEKNKSMLNLNRARFNLPGVL